MSNLQFDVTRDCGVDNTPGIEEILYLACKCDIDVFPAIVGTTNQGDSITLSGDITLLPGKKFWKLEVITSTGEIELEKVGAKTSSAVNQMLKFKTAGGINYDEFFNNNLNGCFIGILVQKDGNRRIFGHPTKGHAYIDTAKYAGGSSNDTERAWDVQMKSEFGKVPYYYTGAIDTTA